MPLAPDLATRLTSPLRNELRGWVNDRLALAPTLSDLGLTDDFRLPGREGLATPAAVLIPLVNRPHGISALFTLRSADLADHAGQISFPGGRTEDDDPSPEHTALRESAEEIGLAAHHVTLLGRLANYDTATGFRVTPVVGWLEPPFELTPDPTEVAEVFEVPLAFLLDTDNYQRHRRQFFGRERHYYAVPFENRFIWGATAAMLLMLSHTLNPLAGLPRDRA